MEFTEPLFAVGILFFIILFKFNLSKPEPKFELILCVLHYQELDPVYVVQV